MDDESPSLSPVPLVRAESNAIKDLFLRGIPEGTTNAQLYAEIGFPDPPFWRFPGILEYAIYLRALADYGFEITALEKAQLTIMRVEQRCAIDKQFADLRTKALGYGRRFHKARLERATLERAVNGVEKGIYYMGDQVDTEMVFDNRLALGLLVRDDQREEKERLAAQFAESAGDSKQEVEAASRQIFRKLLGAKQGDELLEAERKANPAMYGDSEPETEQEDVW